MAPMKKNVALCVLFFIATQLFAAPDLQKTEDIKKLLTMTGSLKIGAQFAGALSTQMTSLIKKVQPAIPDSVIVIMNEELKLLVDEAMTEKSGLVESFCSIYDRYYTRDEIKKLIAFYQTPIGKKTIEVLPSIMQESMAVGQAWGQSIAPVLVERLMKRMKTRGIELPKI
jgi:uncharacterized protein